MNLENKRKKIKEIRGITLIALVVTIVVLLILAGISINLVIGQNGIIGKAKNASNSYKQGSINEESEMNNAYSEIESIVSNSQRNYKFNVTTLVDRLDYSEQYGCIYSDQIIVKANVGYNDALEYWIKEKANLSEKERMAYNLYGTAYGDLLELLEDLKANNITLSQYCELQGSTLDETLYIYSDR